MMGPKHAWRWWGVVLSASAGSSCAANAVAPTPPSPPAPESVPLVAAPATNDPNSPILYAESAGELAPVPPHLVGPLPRSLTEFSRFWNGYPGFRSRLVVEDLACVGYPRLLEELQEAMLAAAQAGASAADLGKSYGRLWAECQNRGACAWARRLLVGSEQRALRSVAYWALVPCSGDNVEELFDAPAVPARPLIEHRFRMVEPPQHSVALEQAASVVIRTGTTEDARRAALVLGSVKHPRAASVLLELLAETADPERAVAIGLALGQQTEPRAQAAFRRACKQDPSNLLCIPNVPGATIADASDQEPAGPAELRRCVENRENADQARYICFEQLARLERSLAADIARSRSSEDLTASPDPWMGELATTLVRFPNTESLRRRLVALGLLDQASRFEPHHLTARSLLSVGGRVVGVSSHQKSVNYDFELRRMAVWAGPPLADVVFEQKRDTAAEGPNSYQIRAYAGGHRWSVRPKPGTCHDLGAMVRLFNAVLRHLAVEHRFIPLDTNDEMLWAVYGPESALVELVNEGLLRPGSGQHMHKEDHGDPHGHGSTSRHPSQ